jgi:hypothetical protein
VAGYEQAIDGDEVYACSTGDREQGTVIGSGAVILS